MQTAASAGSEMDDTDFKLLYHGEVTGQVSQVPEVVQTICQPVNFLTLDVRPPDSLSHVSSHVSSCQWFPAVFLHFHLCVVLLEQPPSPFVVFPAVERVMGCLGWLLTIHNYSTCI